MAAFTVQKKKPESNKKKIIIISSIVAIVCLSASGGLYYVFKGKANDDEPWRIREWHDPNTPNPLKQSGKEMADYMASDRFKQLSGREQMNYARAGFEKVMDYHIETYFSIPKEQKTAYLDKLIDQMQAQRANFEQNRPRRDANDPNRQRRIDRARQQQNRGGGTAASRGNRSRARSERGTPEQRAQRMQFMADMGARMQQRGISMPFGGGGRGPGGGGGRGGR